ncbi:MAG: prephenate dehydrogenase/arogenate dehydrogenase family protein, partial [Actinomycetota bacterium]|nr:prephenate dehydrogenase/arogenate dehydrogenase family protein [Actinomycetota bacterium]
MRFSTVCVIGVGLIGGSFAAACKRLDADIGVLGIDTDTAALALAAERGLIDAGATPDSARAAGWFSPTGSPDFGAPDLVVLATPAAISEDWLGILGAEGYAGVVTDVASTKRGVQAAASALCAYAAFVGGHPMAGSEASGVAAARADLFDGAYYVLTPASDTDMDAYRRLHSFIGSLGARVISVDASAHDEAVAIISHVPHVTASALVDLAKAHAGEGDELLRLAAGGFKDTTRIAAGSPDLWTGICLDNAEALAEGIDELRDVLGGFAQMVRARDAEGVRAWLAHAAD